MTYLTARQLQTLLAAAAGLQAEAARGFSQPLPKPCFSTAQTAESAQLPWVSAVCLSLPRASYLQRFPAATATPTADQHTSPAAVSGPQVSVPELAAAVVCTSAGAWRPVAAVQLSGLQLAGNPHPVFIASTVQLHTGAMPASAAAACHAALPGSSSAALASVAAQHVQASLVQPPAAVISGLSCGIQRPSPPQGLSVGPTMLAATVCAASLAAWLSPRSWANLAALGLAVASGGPALPPVPLIPPADLKNGPEIKVCLWCLFGWAQDRGCHNACCHLPLPVMPITTGQTATAHARPCQSLAALGALHRGSCISAGQTSSKDHVRCAGGCELRGCKHAAACKQLPGGGAHRLPGPGSGTLHPGLPLQHHLGLSS